MSMRTRFLTLGIVFLLGISGFCHQVFAQTHGAMMMGVTPLSEESPCSSFDCYEPSFQCRDDDHELGFLGPRAFKNQISVPPFQASPSLFQYHVVQRDALSFQTSAIPAPSLTGIVVKQE